MENKSSQENLNESSKVNLPSPEQGHTPSKRLRQSVLKIQVAAAVAKPKSHQFSEIFKDFVLYLFFVGLFCAVVYLPRTGLMPYMQNQAVASAVLSQPNLNGVTFPSIATSSDYYAWLKDVLIPNLYPTTWYNGDTLETTEEQLMTSFGCYRYGLAQIRFQRVKPDCNVYAPLQELAIDCFPHLTASTRDTQPWNGITFQTSDETKIPSFYSYFTRMTYDGSGYVINLPPNATNAIAFVESLEANGTIDSSTRMVVTELSLYNPGTDLFVACKFLLELLPSGYVQTSQVIRAVNLFTLFRPYNGDRAITLEMVAFLLMWIFYAAVIVFCSIAIKECWCEGFRVWFSDSENKIEFTYLMLLLVQICMRFKLWSMVETLKADGLFSLQPDRVSDVDHITWYSQTIDNVTATCAILLFGKILTYLRADQSIHFFSGAMFKALDKMNALLPIIFILGSGFSIAFQSSFGNEVSDWMTWRTSMLSLFRALVGDFDIQQLRNTSYVFGPMLFVGFVVLVFFIFLRIFLSIVDIALDEVKHEVTDQKKGMSVVLARADLLKRDIKYLGIQIRKLFGLLQYIIPIKFQHSKVAVIDPDSNGNIVDGFGSPAKGLDSRDNVGGDKFSELHDTLGQSAWKKVYHQLHKELESVASNQKALEEVLEVLEKDFSKQKKRATKKVALL